MPDPKTITEESTLADLREQRLLLGVIALHVYLAPDGDVAASAQHASGFFEGRGPTEAVAIEAAFTKLRRALLPEPLKQYLEESAEENPSPDITSKSQER